MNQEIIKLTKESIVNCKDTELSLESKIDSLNKEIEQAKRELFRVNNVRQSLEAAFTKLVEANEKEEAGIKLEEEIKEEPSAMEKIIEESEEDPQELTPDEEKAEVVLKKADRLIVAGKKAMKEEKKGWKKCPKCNRRPIAPWNKKGICSHCQQAKKSKEKKGDEL